MSRWEKAAVAIAAVVAFTIYGSPRIILAITPSSPRRRHPPRNG